MLEGIPHRLEIPIWRRGPARILQSPSGLRFIALDPGRSDAYAVVGSAGLVFDLERVTDEQSALQFVGRYGMLDMQHRPFFGEVWVMELAQFLQIAKWVRTCLQIYRWLRPAVEGDPEAVRELRKLEGEAREVTGRAGMGVTLEPGAEALLDELNQRARSARPRRATDAELLALSAQALAFLINIGLVGVEERVSASLAWPAPREGAEWPVDAFTVSVQPNTLRGAVFHHLALVILNRRPLEVCERCQALYFREDPRQRFCTALCADRSRRERHRKKQRLSETTRARGKGGRHAKKTTR